MTVTIVKGLAQKLDSQVQQGARSGAASSASASSGASSGATAAASAAGSAIVVTDAAVTSLKNTKNSGGVDKVREPKSAEKLADSVASRLRESGDTSAHDLDGVDARGHFA